MRSRGARRARAGLRRGGRGRAGRGRGQRGHRCDDPARAGWDEAATAAVPKAVHRHRHRCAQRRRADGGGGAPAEPAAAGAGGPEHALLRLLRGGGGPAAARRGDRRRLDARRAGARLHPVRSLVERAASTLFDDASARRLCRLAWVVSKVSGRTEDEEAPLSTTRCGRRTCSHWGGGLDELSHGEGCPAVWRCDLCADGFCSRCAPEQGVCLGCGLALCADCGAAGLKMASTLSDGLASSARPVPP